MLQTRYCRVLTDTGRRFCEMSDRIYSLPSVLARFEDIGMVSRQQALDLGAVGMAARTCGIPRDIRKTHPFQFYKNYPVRPVTFETGDVFARGMLRNLEVRESVKIIHELLAIWRQKNKDIQKPVYDYKLKPDSFATLDGRRMERRNLSYSHDGSQRAILNHYKVKDPSMHNWMALALAVRNQEISDFPVCNKSFNLSYCGNDL